MAVIMQTSPSPDNHLQQDPDNGSSIPSTNLNPSPISAASNVMMMDISTTPTKSISRPALCVNTSSSSGHHHHMMLTSQPSNQSLSAASSAGSIGTVHTQFLPIWKFAQCFGDKNETIEVAEGKRFNSRKQTTMSCHNSSATVPFFVFIADIISAVQFDSTGEFLASGDRAGRVVMFERNQTVCRKQAQTLFYL